MCAVHDWPELLLRHEAVFLSEVLRRSVRLVLGPRFSGPEGCWRVDWPNSSDTHDMAPYWSNSRLYRMPTNARPARDINDYTTHGCKKTLKKKPLKTLFTVLLFCACCFICRLYLHMDLFSFYAKPYVLTFYLTVCESHIALKASWLDLTCINMREIKIV